MNYFKGLKAIFRSGNASPDANIQEGKEDVDGQGVHLLLLFLPIPTIIIVCDKAGNEHNHANYNRSPANLEHKRLPGIKVLLLEAGLLHAVHLVSRKESLRWIRIHSLKSLIKDSMVSYRAEVTTHLNDGHTTAQEEKG